jgi:hypothetical protein
LSACGGNTGAINDTFCLLYQPVFASGQDTAGTLAQVDVNNGIFECRCRNDCPKFAGPAPP